MVMAAQRIYIPIILLVFFIFSFPLPSYTKHLPSSQTQTQTLLRIQKLLNFPLVLSSWNHTTDFCNIEPTQSLTVVCYEKSITQLHIFGDKGTPSLPQNFSLQSFFTTLVGLPTLKVLSLVSLGLWGALPPEISHLSSLEILNLSSNYFYGEIPQETSSLGNLQTLIFDNNLFSGHVPDWLADLPVLTVLSLKNNSFTGSLPISFSSLENLRVLALSMNRLSGEVPDLTSLTNLQVLDLEDNYFGPKFPSLGRKLVTLVLRKNRFSSAIKANEISSYYQLKRFDVSFNRFVGPFPSALLSLPSITYLNIAGNRFTGMLMENMSCNSELGFVDLSSNLLIGRLPTCLLSSPKNKIVRYSRNCLETGDQNQHPYFFCRNEALAVGILPSKQKHQRRAAKLVLALTTVGVLAGFVLIFLIIFFFVRKENVMRKAKTPPTRLIKENVSSGYTSKLLSDARYISQTMRLGALGLPNYRAFSLEELEEATNNFDSSAFLGEGAHGQMYRGKLRNDSFVAIRCLKVKGRRNTQSFMHHIELISKLRHHHLVSSIGHCFECYLDDSSVSRIFLVFEYVPNGTLRSHITDGFAGQRLTWAQRIGAMVGVAKGIQYLHSGIVPGVFSNNLKITDILLDRSLVAKISSYNLPLLAENVRKVGKVSSSGSKEHNLPGRKKDEDKIDVYDFGVILLEIIIGRSITTPYELENSKDELQVGVMGDEDARRRIVDSTVGEGCSDESLKTVMDICYKTLSDEPTERPSIEDVLWNLQFAAQVQEEWDGDSGSNKDSPTQPPSLQLTS